MVAGAVSEPVAELSCADAVPVTVDGLVSEPFAEESCADTVPVIVVGADRKPLVDESCAVTVPVIVDTTVDPLDHVTLSVATSGSVSE
jgi:hypothetical protein